MPALLGALTRRASILPHRLFGGSGGVVSESGRLRQEAAGPPEAPQRANVAYASDCVRRLPAPRRRRSVLMLPTLSDLNRRPLGYELSHVPATSHNLDLIMLHIAAEVSTRRNPGATNERPPRSIDTLGDPPCTR